MKKLLTKTSVLKGVLAAVVLLLSCSSSVFAAAVGHSFKLQLPDGSTVPINGASVHTIYVDRSDNNTTSREYSNDVCKPEANDDLKGSAQCITSSSCDFASWQAPMLPNGFQGDATFQNAARAQGLTLQTGNIRGFAGAYWVGEIAEYCLGGGCKRGADQSKIVSYELPSQDPTVFKDATISDTQGTGFYPINLKGNLDSLWKQGAYGSANPKWNGDIANSPKKEILFDNIGGNVLHTNVKWVLKTPAAPKNPPAAQVNISGANCKGNYATNNAITFSANTTGGTPNNAEIFLAKLDGTETTLVDWNTVGGCPTGTNPGLTLAVNQTHFFCKFNTNANSTTLSGTWTPPANAIGKYYILVNAYDTANNLNCSGNPTCNYNSESGIGTATCETSFSSCSNKDSIRFEVVSEASCATTTPTPTPTPVPVTLSCGQTGCNSTDHRCQTGFTCMAYGNQAGGICVKGEIASTPAYKSVCTAAIGTPTQQTSCCTIPTPTPTPAPHPMCLNIVMRDPLGVQITDFTKLYANRPVFFECGYVAGVSKYQFRVVQLNSAGQPVNANPAPLPQGNGNLSSAFTIPSSGTFIAQCAICPAPDPNNPTVTPCEQFEPIVSGQPQGATPAPTAAPATATPAPTPTPWPSCSSKGGVCSTTAACYITSQIPGTSGCTASQVCCNPNSTIPTPTLRPQVDLSCAGNGGTCRTSCTTTQHVITTAVCTKPQVCCGAGAGGGGNNL